MESKQASVQQPEMMTGFNFKQSDADDNQKASYKDWDTQEVGSWLSKQIKLPQYSSVFEEMCIDGAIIDHVTDTDLETDFGIAVRLHRVKIIQGIKKLQVIDQDKQVPSSSTNVHMQQAASDPPASQQQPLQYNNQPQLERHSSVAVTVDQQMSSAQNAPFLPQHQASQPPQPMQHQRVPLQQPVLTSDPASSSNLLGNNGPAANQFMQHIQANQQQQVVAQPESSGVGPFQQRNQSVQQATNMQSQLPSGQMRIPFLQAQIPQPVFSDPSSSGVACASEVQNANANGSGNYQDSQMNSNLQQPSSQSQSTQQQQVVALEQQRLQQMQNQRQQQYLQAENNNNNNVLQPGQVRMGDARERVATPPHSNQRQGGGAGANNHGAPGENAYENISNQAVASSASAQDGMHVFVNSVGADIAGNPASGSHLDHTQQNDILVLKAVEGQLLNNVYIIGDNGAALGRHSASNDMVISESFVSRRHCEIKYVAGSNHSSGVGQPDQRHMPSADGELTNFYLRDIGSTTGTFVMVRQEMLLKSNMMFQMGLSEFKVVTTSKPSMCELHVFEGPSRNRMVPVDDSGLTIGRDPNNTFCVQEDSQMSNFHAKVTYHSSHSGAPGAPQGGFLLTDVGSTNRTWLRLSAEGEQSNLHPLKIGDILKIGSTVFVVESSDIHNLKNMPVINKRVQGVGANGQIAVVQQSAAEEGAMPRVSSAEDLMIDEEEKHAGEFSQPGGGAGAKATNGVNHQEMCKLCYEAECDAAFIPCGHVTACVKCASRCDQCPVCRMQYNDIMKLYKQ